MLGGTALKIKSRLTSVHKIQADRFTENVSTRKASLRYIASFRLYLS
jgi:hypothetical protein